MAVLTRGLVVPLLGGALLLGACDGDGGTAPRSGETRVVLARDAAVSAGRETALTIPAGRIRTPVEFMVDAQTGATIKLVFEAEASVKKVTVTGADRVMMPPVISARRVRD